MNSKEVGPNEQPAPETNKSEHGRIQTPSAQPIQATRPGGGSQPAVRRPRATAVMDYLRKKYLTEQPPTMPEPAKPTPGTPATPPPRRFILRAKPWQVFAAIAVAWLFFYALANRYDIVPDDGRGFYRFDRWTNSTEYVRGFVQFPVESRKR